MLVSGTEGVYVRGICRVPLFTISRRIPQVERKTRCEWPLNSSYTSSIYLTVSFSLGSHCNSCPARKWFIAGTKGFRMGLSVCLVWSRINQFCGLESTRSTQCEYFTWELVGSFDLLKKFNH